MRAAEDETSSMNQQITRSSTRADAFRFLAFPAPDTTRASPPGFLLDPSATAEIVVLTAPVSERELTELMHDFADPLLPVVSLVGDRHRRIDRPLAPGESPWQRAAAIAARLRKLPRSARYASALDDTLLAFMYSRTQALIATYDGGSPDLVRYPFAWPAREVAEAGERLHDAGLANRAYFERVHHCPHCACARLVVREECARCRSSNLVDEVTVHHFRCAHIGPLSEFRSGRALECPKCHKELLHIGLDYDKPGSITRCGACGHVSDKPVVGFVCTDCGAHSSAEAVAVRAWHSYAPTAAGLQHVLAGAGRSALPGGPDAFDVLLGHCRRETQEFGTPFTVARLSFAHEEAIRAQDRRLWSESLGLMEDVLASALRSVDLPVRDGEGFLVLLPRTDEAGAQAAMAQVAERARAVLSADLGLVWEVLDEVAIRRLREGARPR